MDLDKDLERAAELGREIEMAKFKNESIEDLRNQWKELREKYRGTEHFQKMMDAHWDAKDAVFENLTEKFTI